MEGAVEVPARARVVDAFRIQGRGCAGSGSPFYAELLARLADDLAAGGPLAELLDGWRGDPVPDALPLRLLGALHAEVLSGRAEALAPHYARPDAAAAAAAWPALRAFVAEHPGRLRPTLEQPVQTNEVRRAAALLGGFLAVAARTALPLRVLEIGASAGLLLRFDHYRYALGAHAWGDPAAPLRIETDWSGPPPALDAPLRVIERAGCDRAPIDVRDPEARLRLASFVWPDHPDRLALLRAALALAAEDPPPIERASAADWLARKLARPVPGRATVVSQSVVWWYLSEAERAEVGAILEAAGERASAEAPLAWLRMEGARLEGAEVRLRCWPDGAEERLAFVHWHGRFVRFGSAADA